MKDVQSKPNEESTYECFNCGTVVRAATSTRCPDCDAEMRNRGTPLL